MPASPPGNVFPTLVVVGHIVTLIAVWRWRIRQKEGKNPARSSAQLFRGNFSSESPAGCPHPSSSLVLCVTTPLFFFFFPSPPPHTSQFPVVWRG